MIWVLAAFLILTVSILIISRFCYKMAFYSLNEQEQDIYVIPPGKQYEAVAEEILAVINEVDRLPYELVSTKSYDGITLVGRYYHFADGAPLQLITSVSRGSSR